jgi:hypothetical protein
MFGVSVHASLLLLHIFGVRVHAILLLLHMFGDRVHASEPQTCEVLIS